MNDDGFFPVQVPAPGALHAPRPPAPPVRARRILVTGSLMVALCVGGFGLGRSVAGNHESIEGTGVSQTGDAAEGQDSGSTTVAQVPASDEGPGGETD